MGRRELASARRHSLQWVFRGRAARVLWRIAARRGRILLAGTQRSTRCLGRDELERHRWDLGSDSCHGGRWCETGGGRRSESWRFSRARDSSRPIVPSLDVVGLWRERGSDVTAEIQRSPLRRWPIFFRGWEGQLWDRTVEWIQ